ncbi:VOC family protein [Catellatospora sp. KI3]|uniref:VOC family protein n=1 Tax=Catellatospora sp. KI3 TaxID=3041620 RepID=UPI002482984C|nr:VOC family protein [Catellatospora sp. KI3]MDI1459668.1 VOC family protein [Catellatospora sp. KI3]
MIHHVEVWVPDLAETERSWGWLLTELGWAEFQRFPGGVSWRHGTAYLVFEQSPALTGDRHDRRAPGLNHLALHAGPRPDLDRLVDQASAHGWTLMFPDRHPHAGGPDTYAAYLHDTQGYEVELVAG